MAAPISVAVFIINVGTHEEIARMRMVQVPDPGEVLTLELGMPTTVQSWRVTGRRWIHRQYGTGHDAQLCLLYVQGPASNVDDFRVGEV